MKRMKYIVKIYFRFDGLITGDLITGGGGGGEGGGGGGGWL